MSTYTVRYADSGLRIIVDAKTSLEAARAVADVMQPAEPVVVRVTNHDGATVEIRVEAVKTWRAVMIGLVAL